MPYCDGASFSGDATEPVVFRTQTLYFRGRRILDSVIADLFANQKFGTATDVLLTGCSAGGLSTFLHADYVGTLLPNSVTRYKAMPGSGFFLFHDNAVGIPVYPNQMQTVFTMQNSSGGVNAKCIAAMQPENQWNCIFAQHSYAYTITPIFPLNSLYDIWQIYCIETAEPVVNLFQNGNCSAVPGWSGCLTNLTTCSLTEVNTLNSYHSTFITDITNSSTLSNPGNGAFLDSCYTHCEFQSSLYNSININGVSMMQAVNKWWTSPVSTPSAELTHIDCTWTSSSPHLCNPTC